MDCVKYNKIDPDLERFSFPGYRRLAELRERVDDCLKGLRTMEEKQKYLPPTKWQRSNSNAYIDFLYRSLFPMETKSSLDIYEGLFRIGTPTVELPEDGRMNYLIKDASLNHDGLKNIQIRLNKEQMSHGLRVLLLEVRSDAEKPFFIQEYDADKFISFHYNEDNILDMVLLDESCLYHDVTDWTYTKVTKFRILALDSNGQYYQRSVAPKELDDFDIYNPPQDEDTIYPDYQEKRFDMIPIVFCGAKGLSCVNLDDPQLIATADCEIKLFKSMAHNSQHIYMNTQESIVITGVSNSFQIKDDEFVAGAVVVIPGESAKAQYLSTNGIGFEAEEKEITRLKETIESQRMSMMSAKSHQSTETVSLQQNSHSAPLRTIVEVSGDAITFILKYIAVWMGYDSESVENIVYIPSESFANPKYNISEFISLSKAVASGEVKMLEEDLFQMAKESRFVTSKYSWDVFKKKYDIELEERKNRDGVFVSGNGNPFAGKFETPKQTDEAQEE
jgi:hypothetical protein